MLQGSPQGLSLAKNHEERGPLSAALQARNFSMLAGVHGKPHVPCSGHQDLDERALWMPAVPTNDAPAAPNPRCAAHISCLPQPPPSSAGRGTPGASPLFQLTAFR